MPKGYPKEFKDKALRLVESRIAEGAYASKQAIADEIAPMLGINSNTLLKWMAVAGLPKSAETELAYAEQAAEIKRLRRENAELRKANEILKLASAFFARELDQPGR